MNEYSKIEKVQGLEDRFNQNSEGLILCITSNADGTGYIEVAVNENDGMRAMGIAGAACQKILEAYCQKGFIKSMGDGVKIMKWMMDKIIEHEGKEEA